jgi:hypothetical protein
VISRRDHEITNQKIYFSPELHQDSLERPLLYMVVEEMTRATEMIFSRRMSGSALAEALLTIPAERQSVRGGPRATNANGEGSYSRRGHRAVTEVPMAVRRAIGDMSTRRLASTRAT